MGRRLKGARFDDVAADRQKRLVNPLNDVRPREDKMIVATLQRLPTKVIRRGMMQLNTRSHRAIEDEDALAQCLEIGMELRVSHDARNEKGPNAVRRAGALAIV